MTVLERDRQCASQWIVPGDVDPQRVLVLCLPSGQELDLGAALDPARASVLVLDVGSGDAARAVADTVGRLLRDGCDPHRVAVAGVGPAAAAALGAFLLLRIGGRALPSAFVTDFGGDAEVLGPEAPTEFLVRQLAACALVTAAGGDIASSVRRAAVAVDRALAEEH